MAALFPFAKRRLYFNTGDGVWEVCKYEIENEEFWPVLKRVGLSTC